MPEPTAAPAAPVVVTPIPTKESRTLRTVFWATVGAIIAAGPDIVATIAELMSYSEVSQLVYQYIPVPLRAVIGIVYVVLLRRLGWLRKDTVAPIAGTTAAKATQPLSGTFSAARINPAGDQS